MSEAGFLISGDSFVWSRTGLLKIKELEAGESLLGIDRNGKPFWSTFREPPRKSGRNRLLRITTDGSELILSKSGEVFTIDGIKKASDVVPGEILETFNIPAEIQKILDSNDFVYVESEAGPIKIDRKMAYVLGTQIKSKKYENKVVINGLNIDHAYSVAKLCSEALKEQHIQGEIYYVKGGRKIRADSPILAEICYGISESDIPLSIRKSPAAILREFLCGILDATMYWNKAESPPAYFVTLAKQSEVRRFMFNVLRLFGVIPARAQVIHPASGLTYVRSFVNTQDLSELGLRFIRLKEPAKEVKPSARPISYSKIRAIAEFEGTAYHLQEPQLHWSPIVDLTPLHRQPL